ncbi:S8 family serine peptidase [Elongatibacter sediminis]|uniref:S8 family serine peptidase n=1 Tax=Elongatibacter sediminis TaxID=3119006 RepID=A0AAW9RLY3_9GAMM
MSSSNRLFRILAGALTLAMTATVPVHAAGERVEGLQRYVVEFQDAPLAAYDGGVLMLPDAAGSERLEATSPTVTGMGKLNVRSPRSQAYLRYLDDTHGAFRLEAAQLLGRTVDPVHVYRNALNGMVLDLTPAEAAELSGSPMVRSIAADTRHRLETDAGPEWMGAGSLWNGTAGFPASEGEGVVVGVIDSGINWDHPSFADPANDGHNHVNPFGDTLGLCEMEDVPCNNKLVGVYDFVEDDPGTSDVVEENTNGKDNSGHGSHVAGIAVGNRINVTLNGTVNTRLSGVAPHANLVAYRVCYIGDPPADDGGGCLGSAILSAIDQAIADGVDVINYSIGTDAFSPWSPGSIPIAFRNARNAGIFVVTSGGNSGPNPGTVGSPANAPWVVAAGNATHNRVFGSLVENLSGGVNPPEDIVGASLSGGIGTRPIVHAKDFGFPLCGTGPAELGSSCGDNTGASNPWQGQTPFNGEIVVCDRGTYGRVEKGKNVMLAGAGGFILANTDAEGESIVADDHCLPASHIGAADGNTMRTWLDSGANHQGGISGFVLAEADRFGDQLSASSSRGPVLEPVQDTLKPNVIAPGTSILSASEVEQQFTVLSGTSMASPHVAGAAALLLSVNPSWSPAQIASSLELTASADLATDIDGEAANPHERGAGRPQLGDAANAGFFLDVSNQEFVNANPSLGGEPRDLNLPALVHSACAGTCSFQRTVTDQMGGGSWSYSAVHFPAGTGVTVTPANFTLSNGGSRTLDIEIDVESSGIVGEWVYGDVVFSAAGSPDLVMTVAVYASGGDLPDVWFIDDDRSTGWTDFQLSDLAAMPDATFLSGGLVAPTRTVQNLMQDPTASDPAVEKGRLPRTENEDPFDGGSGVFTVWHNLPQGGLWLHAETLASTAADLDLFVGRDDNLDNDADENEVLCESTTSGDIENCDLYNLEPGNYWIVVQNWDGTQNGGDEATLLSAAVDASDGSRLVVSGPGIVGKNDEFTLRASWSDISALPGEQVLGAIGIGTRRDVPNNIGVIPVRFNRTGIATPQTLPLFAGETQRFALAGNAQHDRIFIDIPPGVTALDVSAQGRNSSQSDALSLELFRQDFGTALDNPPFDENPGGLAAAGSANGSGGNGPQVSLNGTVTPGRYFVRVSNGSGSPAAVSLLASVSSSTSTLTPHRGLWDFDRGIAQGAEWNAVGDFRFAVWYAYDKAGQPTWYIASGPEQVGNIWVADLLRVTNDGSEQQEKRVGRLAMTFLADNEVIMAYSVLGAAGFDPMHPNGPNTCPDIGGLKSYTGHWYRGVSGLGGSTVLVYASAQAQVHYLFDAVGVPRWVLAADDGNQSATAEVIPMLQFEGFCATCAPTAVDFDTMGTVTRTFGTQTSGSWTLDIGLLPPLSQTVNRTDSIEKLSDTLACP